METILITGGTGFVGKHLSKLLDSVGYKVIILSRGKRPANGDIHYAQWNPDKQEIDTDVLKDVDVVVHLAGAGVADKRWTDVRKKEIIASRVDATDFLINQLKTYAPGCRAFIAASATGYYGPDRENRSFIETDRPFNDFLASVCVQWEAASMKAEALYRTAIFRFGIVLGIDGGAYPELSGPMKFGIMPVLGSGRQMVSWIHIEDLAQMIAAALKNEKYTGIYNAVAPHPITHLRLMKEIASAKGGIKVPAPVPPFVLKIIMGESSIEVLKSCTVSAEKVTNTGFQFQYPEIHGAVQNIVNTAKK